MLLELEAVLDAATLKRVGVLLAKANFVDGRASAGAYASTEKNNEELARGDPLTNELNRAILAPLFENDDFRNAVFPLRLSGAYFARYLPGMSYGRHLDDPVMGPPAGDRKSTRLNSSHSQQSRMPSSA